MPGPLFFPPFLRRTRRCPRCGLWFPKKSPECTHCASLDEAGLARLTERFGQEHEGNANLGRTFLLLAAILLVFVIGLLAAALV